MLGIVVVVGVGVVLVCSFPCFFLLETERQDDDSRRGFLRPTTDRTIRRDSFQEVGQTIPVLARDMECFR